MSNMSQETFNVPANMTDVQPSSSPGLAAGLTLFFLILILVIVAGLIIYKRRSNSRNMLQPPQRSIQKKDPYSETTRDDSHQYSSMYRDQSISQSPVYENLGRTAGYRRPEVDQRR